MPEVNLEQFHFLRPFWLLVILAAVALHLFLRTRFNAALQWRKAIAPELLEHLTVSSSKADRIRPYQLMTAFLIIAAVALAGPTWQREITPFTEDRAPLIIALELTPTMLSTDQAPTRLERAKHKLRDILERRKRARTAVVAYAGSAHAVLPLTDDASLIETYLDSLNPSLMPSDGDDASTALALAQRMLKSQEAAGTILFMSDGIDRTHAAVFAEHKEKFKDQILILAIGTEAGGSIDETVAGGKDFGLVDGAAPGIDLAGLKAINEAVGGILFRLTPDLADVEDISRTVRSHLVDTVQEDENLQWQDFGYFLVWPLAFILLLWARRGWTVRWT